MAQLQRRLVRRWPVAVLAAAAVAAVSLGDLVAGWYAVAGRGPSAAGEYPVRIALREAGSAASRSRSLALEHETGTGSAEIGTGGAEAGSEAATPANVPADLLLQGSANPLFAEAPPDRRPTTDELLAVQFDLADPERSDSGGSALEIRKGIRLNGADAGDARIHVDASSSLSIAREELGRLLARSGRQELMEQLSSAGRFVSFDEMRRQGIEVRYDPVTDRILVST